MNSVCKKCNYWMKNCQCSVYPIYKNAKIVGCSHFMPLIKNTFIKKIILFLLLVFILFIMGCSKIDNYVYGRVLEKSTNKFTITVEGIYYNTNIELHNNITNVIVQTNVKSFQIKNSEFYLIEEGDIIRFTKKEFFKYAYTN